jgi:hypothetical protein
MISLSVTDESLVNQIDERNQFFHLKYVSVIIVFKCVVTCCCLTLNSRTNFMKSHSIDNKTIYILGLID